jgi:glycosyltransferase involved in cell wall biosynthesis
MAKTICMISCLHGLYDDRIYWKEALSLQKNGYSVCHIGVGDKDGDTVSDEGIRLIEIKRITYFKNPYADKLFRILSFRPSVYSKIFRIAESLQAGVYHLHDLQLNRIGPGLKQLKHKPKVVYDVHEPYPEIIRYLNPTNVISSLISVIYSKFIEKWQLKKAREYDLIIATEENVAGYFSRVTEKVRIIHNYSSFSGEDQPSMKMEYNAIYAGGISSRRGISEMLEVARSAKKEGLNFKILFIGPVKETGLEKKIRKYINRHNLESVFFLKKMVPYEQIKEYYSRSGIGICLFRDNPVYHILLPIKIFEYMAFGLPVLCNDFGHPGRIIKKEKCGIATGNPEPEEILNAMLKILNDKKLYSEMSVNGKTAVETTYNWKNEEKKLLGLYQELLP